MKRYNANDISFKQIDKEFVANFMKYLKGAVQEHSLQLKTLNSTTQLFYYKLLKFVLNYAISDGIKKEYLLNKAKKEDISKTSSKERVYLTLEEIKALIDTKFTIKH